jgi:alpha-L-fucosidase
MPNSLVLGRNVLVVAVAAVLSAVLTGADGRGAAAATTDVTPSAASPVVAISPQDTPAQIAAKAASVTPSPRQLTWQRMELTAFIHFGVNTYTGREHGTGTENPDIFQPHELDTDQWATALRDAGFKLVILTVKHHDGFLLFPSRYSGFGVASSSWRGGSGDVARSFADSARRQGLKVGFYISPSDLHEAQPGGRFANSSPARARTIPGDPADVVGGRTFQVTADDYNTYFMNNLYELLTRYGSVDEVWWDGANPTGKHQDYNYTDWIRIVRTLQPDAVMFQDIDNRWVGNEDGIGRQSEWSPLPLVGDPATAADRFLAPEDERAVDLAGDAVLAQRRADGTSRWNLLRWTPAECDTSIMHDGWFWPTNSIKTPSQLEDTYYTSVGRNCQLLLNFGPDGRGLFDQPTLDAMSAFGDTVRSTFATDLAAGASAGNDAGTGNTAGHTPALAVDRDLDTSWQPTGRTGSLVLDLGGSRTFDVVSVQEDLGVGMRTQGFAVDSWDGTGWNQVATDTTVGHKKLVRLATPVTTSRVRLRVTEARANPAIAAVGLFRRPARGGDRTGPIRSGIAGKCVDVNGNSSANETPVQLWDCNGTAAQNWTVASDGTLRLNGKCMDVYGNASANGTKVQIHDCHGAGNQRWTSRGGALVSATSGRCLDDPGFSTANGTQLVIWDCNGGRNQAWTLP